MSKVIDKVPFKLYPVNKNNANVYSFWSSSPLINFELQGTEQKIINNGSLRLNGYMKIFQKSNKMYPANRFDMNGTADSPPSNEKVCYIDEKVSVASVIQSLTISNVSNSQIFEQIKEYPRMLSSLYAVSSSYYDLCSVAQNLGGSQANNDSISRTCSRQIPFSLSFKSGFLSGGNVSLANGGLKISINLNSDSAVLFGLNAGDFVYSLEDVYLSGEYLVLDKPIGPRKGVIDTYYQFQNYLNTAISSNDHQNLSLGLNNVISIYSNFIRSSWTSNSRYNSLSTPPLKNELNVDKDINQFSFNRGAVKYPLSYNVDEGKSNRNNVYDVLRSRLFLDAVQSYGLLTHSCISPFTQGVNDMVSKRENWLRTPQSCDGGNLMQWTSHNGAIWTRDGEVESSGKIYGIGVRLDMSNQGIAQDYSNANYNYNIQSELEGDCPNSVYTFVLSKTTVVSDGRGNVQYLN